MRLDKFLKLTRLIKRRTLAQDMIEIGAVRINKKNCKSAAEVKVGDIIEVAYPSRVVSVKVLISDEAQIKKKIVAYELLEDKKVDREERPW
ncbi:MAG: RNA-binding S4 domain-containing protein [Synergistaceae bacterium]|nr:RNA-binding S4 domain-containing protein [Synergistaceae bacterium]